MTTILQFGEGNFLPYFIDWMVRRMNDMVGFDGVVRILQSIDGDVSELATRLHARGGRYQSCLRGSESGQTVEEIEVITGVKGVDRWTNAKAYAARILSRVVNRIKEKNV